MNDKRRTGSRPCACQFGRLENSVEKHYALWPDYCTKPPSRLLEISLLNQQATTTVRDETKQQQQQQHFATRKCCCLHANSQSDEHHCRMSASGQQASMKRTRRKTTNEYGRYLSIKIISILILKLICDKTTGQQASCLPFLTSVAAAASGQDASVLVSDSEAAHATTTTTLGAGQDSAQSVSFVEEPQDERALLGQKLVEMRCVFITVAAHAANGSKPNNKWYRGSTLVALNWQALLPHLQVRIERMSLNEYRRSNSAGSNGGTISAEFGHHHDDQSAPDVTIYTLQLNNITLGAEDQYKCTASGRHSRAGRLIVLKAPDRFEIVTSSSSSSSSSSNTGASGQPRLAPSKQHMQTADGGASQTVQATNDNDNSIGQASDEQGVVELESAINAPRRIVATLNARLNLKCRTLAAKPHAELVWLDSNGRPVLNGTTKNGQQEQLDETGVLDDDKQEQAEEELERSVGPEPNDARLKRTQLTYSFRVRIEHHLRVLTCRAFHQAYERDDEPPRSRSVELEVHYEPMIELVKDQAQPSEGAPLKLTCRAHARPQVVSYEWYLDEQVLDGAHKAELRIVRLSRQLHLREIKCCARNALARTCVISRLNITYAPNYVTHLLPASLQPDTGFSSSSSSSSLSSFVFDNDDDAAQVYSTGAAAPTGLASAAGAAANDNKADDSDATLELASQLALAARAGQDVALRCDFDANPRPLQVEWFKINTGWPVIKDVTPAEADELIEGGAVRAHFVRNHVGVLRAHRAQNNDHKDDSPDWPNRRPIIDDTGVAVASRRSSTPAAVSSQQIDFEKMSTELLDELRRFDRIRAAQHQDAAVGQQQQQGEPSESNETPPTIEQIVTEPFVQTQARIYEPVAFVVRPHRAGRARLQSAHHHNSLLSTAANDEQPQSSTSQGDESELVLLASGHSRSRRPAGATSDFNVSIAPGQQQTDTNERLQWRRAELASSSLVLRRVNGDSAAKYVCRARGPKQTSGWFARAVQLVVRQSPRIVSVREQFAPLGAHQLQLECLVQLNGAAAGLNWTQFLWFRKSDKLNKDQPIDFMHNKATANNNAATQMQRSYTLIEERSPDLLFARSILRINQAEFSDFGQYNCTVFNALGRDSIQISLQPTAPTGLALKMLATLAFSSLFVLFAFVSLVLLLAPCRRLDRNEMAKTAAVVLASGKKQKSNKSNKQDSSVPSVEHADSTTKRAGSTSSDDERSSTAQISSSLSSGDEKSSMKMYHNNNNNKAGQQQQSIISAPSEVTLNGTRLLLGSVHGSGATQACATTQQRRPGSALGGSVAHHQQYAQYSQSRCSLRNIRQQRNKFAAIHESLEHKLQFGRHSSSSAATGPARQDGDDTVTTSQAADPKSARLFGKLWDKFNGVPASGDDDTQPRREAAATSTRTDGNKKQRPTISLPTSFRNMGAGHSLGSTSSGNSSLMGLNAPDSTKCIGQQHDHNQNHTSSDDNLHSSNSRLLDTRQQPPLTPIAHTNHFGPASSDSTYWPSVGSQQQQQQQQAPQYGYSNRVYLDQQQQQSMYANYSMTMHPSQPMVGWDPAVQFEQQTNQQQQPVGEHYQMPQTLLSEQYLAAQMAAAAPAIQQPNMTERPCYATIYAGQQPHYATSKVATVLIPTSDGGDAFFESNYGTLLSKSSAYKTLGYGNNHHNSSAGQSQNAANVEQQQHQHQQQQQQQQQLGSNGTSATSPSLSGSSSSNSASTASSLTTHASNCQHPGTALVTSIMPAATN